MYENAFSELFDGRQPVCVARNRRTTDSQLDILDFAIRGRRRSLEAGEAVKAGNLSQPMNGDDVLNCGGLLPHPDQPTPPGEGSVRRASR